MSEYKIILVEQADSENPLLESRLFNQAVLSETGYTVSEFRNIATKESSPDCYSRYRFGKYQLEIHEDEQYWKLSKKVEESDIEVYENVHIVNNHTQWKPFPKVINNKKPVGIIYTNDDGTYNIIMANSIEEAMKYEFE